MQFKDIKKYMLVLSSNKERLDNANYFKKTYFPDLEFRYVINSKFDELSYKSIKMLPKIYSSFWDDYLIHFKNINEYSCAFEHYRIIKEAYLLNYDYVFICEDDIECNYNIMIINEFLQNAPQNFDLLKIGYYPNNIKTDIYEKWPENLYKNNKIYWLECNNMPRYGTLANIYSKFGMKKYLDFQDNNLTEADRWTYEINNDLKYISTISLFTEKKFKTTIHT